MSWALETADWRAEAAADNGNRFLCGNGYLGVRGTLDEYGKEQLAAVNLAGIYDQVGDGWREPLNAPNPLYTTLTVSGKALALPEIPPAAHAQRVDYRHGLVSRRTTWAPAGSQVTVESERFASMADSHLIGHRYTASATASLEAELRAGIDGDVWDIHGPHYSQIEFYREGDILLCTARVQNGRDVVAVARRVFASTDELVEEKRRAALTVPLRLAPGENREIRSLCWVYTTRDTADPAASALAAARTAGDDAFDAARQATIRCWEAIWADSAVEIEGGPEAKEAETAVNYSLYHLNCIAPRIAGDAPALSIPARGLSGQTYKGAVFWDSEIFMLDYFLHCRPEVARSLVRYRIETLDGALEKAASYGWQGAFYAWESQEDGRDACSDYNVTDVFTGRPVRTYFRDKQVHISAAVVWAIRRYVDVTGDQTLLEEGGLRVILECARFYWSLLLRRLSSDRYEIHDVIGPDEYHERVNNNAYTNRMAQFVFDTALALAKAASPELRERLERETGLTALLDNIDDARQNLYVPQPGSDGVVEQFDGYFRLEDASLDAVRARLRDPREYWGGGGGVASDTQILKQADVVTMLEMFHDDYDPALLEANWAYYEPRTEHGSSLSACMYAMLACRFGRPDLSYPFFLQSATAEIRGGGKQWAGLVYIGGSHPAAAGGAWKVLAQAFAGLHLQGGEPALRPCLPPRWTALRFPFIHRGGRYRADIAPGKADIILLEECSP